MCARMPVLLSSPFSHPVPGVIGLQVEREGKGGWWEEVSPRRRREREGEEKGRCLLQRREREREVLGPRKSPYRDIGKGTCMCAVCETVCAGRYR